jgi:hypothetical protein
MNEKLATLMKWMRDRITLVRTRQVIAKACGDMFQNWNGDYDPARLIGYGWCLLFGMVFIALTVYDTLHNKAFNSMAFSTGGVAIAGQIFAAACGVRVKQNSEVPMPPPQG